MKHCKYKNRLVCGFIKVVFLMPVLLASFSSHAVIVTPDLEVITIPNVGASFQVINLQNTYSSAIPICTYNLPSYSAGAGPSPAAVRIRNVTSNSFEVSIIKPQSFSANSNGPLTPGTVHCFITDTGSFTSPFIYEAASIVSTGTNGQNVAGTWGTANMQDVSAAHAAIANPVVMGQVITSNDAEYSTFWSSGNSFANPPSSGQIFVGKQIGNDALPRANETLGYIVVDGNSTGNINGVDYAFSLGADAIRGVTAPGSYAFTKTYRHGIAVHTAMDGGNGGWAVLFGATPLAGNAILLGVDEDIDRAHTTENVVYWVFDPVNVAELDVTVDDGNVNYTPNTTVVYTAVVTNNGPNVANTVTVSNPLPVGITTMSWTCAHSSAPNCEVTNGAGAINISESALNVGDSLTYTISVDVPANFSGDLSNTISVDSSNFDLLTSNDSATDINTNNADIAVSIDDSSATYISGATASYSVTLSNIGPRTATNAKLVLNDPVNGAIGAWSCTGVNCPVPTSGSGSVAIGAGASDIPSGNTIAYTVAVTTNSGRTGNLDVTVIGSADNADPVAANNSATDTDSQTSSSDIAVTNSDGTSAYLPGTTVVYNVTVSNNGPSDASNVLLNNAEPAGASISSWSCSGGSCPNAAGAGSISETALTLIAGDSLSYVVNVAVPFSFVGNLVNTATVSAVEADPNNTNNSVTDTNTSSPDSDGDGVPDAIEIADGTDPNNPNDFKDSDGDGVPDFIEAAEGTDPNDPLSILDNDGDGLSNYVERGGDKDGDGIGDEFESFITDTDGNNIKDDLDTDADGDGVTDGVEGLADSDGDGIPDFLDKITGGNPQGGDSDADGIIDATECAAYPLCADTDGDFIPNYADNNDDNDSLLTSFELGVGGGNAPDDSDGDSVFDYLEPNETDTDADSIFDYLDDDDDGDGIATIDELDADGDTVGGALNPDDLDNEGIPDYLDADNGDGSGNDIVGSGDSDNDGMSDAQECPLAPMCPDSDGDGVPDYMIANTDSDGDGILDTIEIGNDPANPIDSDADGVPDYLEDNFADTDNDGRTNQLDDDDDNDGIPTIQELGAGGGVDPADSNNDGIPDYLTETKIKTGLNGGAGVVSPLIFGLMLLITIIRNKKYICQLRKTN